VPERQHPAVDESVGQGFPGPSTHPPITGPPKRGEIPTVCLDHVRNLFSAETTGRKGKGER